jgi:hypothetical protein
MLTGLLLMLHVELRMLVLALRKGLIMMMPLLVVWVRVPTAVAVKGKLHPPPEPLPPTITSSAMPRMPLPSNERRPSSSPSSSRMKKLHQLLRRQAVRRPLWRRRGILLHVLVLLVIAGPSLHGRDKPPMLLRKILLHHWRTAAWGTCIVIKMISQGFLVG